MIKTYDIAIVGAGPAGLTAAIYGIRAGKTVVVFEHKSFGGQIVSTPEVENYPGIKNISGFEFAMNLYNQAMDLGAEYINEKVIKVSDGQNIKKVITTKNEYYAKAVILATGVTRRPLGLEGEEELIGKGISYCATCDGAFFRGRDVAVVGGGNTALEDALFLSNYCNKVYLIHRRDAFRAEKQIVNSILQRDNVEIIYDSVVEELLYEDVLQGIKIKNVVTNKQSDISISGLFIAVGQIPDNEHFEELIELDKSGYVIAEEDCTTDSAGIFTAGDCRTKSVRQLTTAVSDGAVSAIGACSFIDIDNN